MENTPITLQTIEAAERIVGVTYTRAEAALSFLGLGTQPPVPSWGLMIQASRDYLDVAAWTALVPGVAVAATVLGFNMPGDVLRDVLDPTIMAQR